MGAGLSQGSILRQLEPGLRTTMLNCQDSRESAVWNGSYSSFGAWGRCSEEKNTLFNLKVAKKKRRKRSFFNCAAVLWHISDAHHEYAWPVFDQHVFVVAKAWESVSVYFRMRRNRYGFPIIQSHFFLLNV